ncbi:MAG: branched-chain amino acid ABC transporter permease [Rhizobiaceae bacterium]|nr:branched-chain amino acid ABC transporter permease [Rhizobiaceae bacterium]
MHTTATSRAMAPNIAGSPTGAIAAGLLVAAIYFVAVPLAFGDSGYFLSVITTMAGISFISFGVWLTFAIGRINLAQAGFALIGAYTTGILVSRFGVSFWICLPLSGVVAAALGGLIGWPVLRLKGVYFAMITLCITEACRLAALSFPAVTRGAQGIVDLPLPGDLSIFGFVLVPAFEKGARLPFFFLAGALMMAGLTFMWLLDTSRVGAVFRSLRQNEDLASSLGINVAKYRVVAFMVSCFYAGVGGAFFAAMQQNVYPTTFQVIDSVYFMVYCFVGGLEFVIGPLIGTVLLMLSFELLHEFQRYQTVIFSGLMILCILLMPNGVLSIFRRRQTVSGEKPDA